MDLSTALKRGVIFLNVAVKTRRSRYGLADNVFSPDFGKLFSNTRLTVEILSCNTPDTGVRGDGMILDPLFAKIGAAA